jgi:hypothetical protein
MFSQSDSDKLEREVHLNEWTNGLNATSSTCKLYTVQKQTGAPPSYKKAYKSSYKSFKHLKQSAHVFQPSKVKLKMLYIRAVHQHKMVTNIEDFMFWRAWKSFIEFLMYCTVYILYIAFFRSCAWILNNTIFCKIQVCAFRLTFCGNFPKF